MENFLKLFCRVGWMRIKRIAIISALADELDVFKRFLTGSEKWDDVDVKLAVGGIGKVSAAAVTQKVISEFKPDVLFFTGMAGSLEKGRSIGDLGIVSACIDSDLDASGFDSSLKIGEFPFVGERIFSSDERLVKLALGSPLKIPIFDAYIASSSIFMDFQKKLNFLEDKVPKLEEYFGGELRRPNLVDMETVGFLKAAMANSLPALAIKTVSNTLEGDSMCEYGETLMDERTRLYLELIAYIITNADL